MTEHVLDGVLFRAAIYLALAFSLGPSLWRGVLGTHEARPHKHAFIAIALLLTFAIGLAIAQATVTFAEALRFQSAYEVLSTTEYGGRLMWLAIAALGHIVSLRITESRTATIASGVVVAFVLSRLGHAALGSELQLLVHTTHVVCVVAWLAGLIFVMNLAARRRLSWAALKGFSRYALALVVAISATGAIRTLAILPNNLEPNSWLLAFAFKLALVALALLIALGHRRKRLPGLRLSSTEESWSRFDVMVTFELWLVVCATLVAALLSQLDPTT